MSCCEAQRGYGTIRGASGRSHLVPINPRLDPQAQQRAELNEETKLGQDIQENRTS